MTKNLQIIFLLSVISGLLVAVGLLGYNARAAKIGLIECQDSNAFIESYKDSALLGREVR